MDRPRIVLIGAAASGKSTVGDLVAAALRVTHVDLDHVAEPYYSRAGWDIARFRAIKRQDGLLVAYEDHEAAMLAALEGVLVDYPMSVISTGAAHAHFLTASARERARGALRGSDVVLLVPSAEDARAVDILRRRLHEMGRSPWADGDVDFVERWVADGHLRSLASRVVYTGGRTPRETADDVLQGR